MKKTRLCFLSLLLTLLLAACQEGTSAEPSRSSPKPATKTQDAIVITQDQDIATPTQPVISDDSIIATPTPDIEITDPKNADLTNRQIIEGILAGDRYTEMGWPLSAYEWDGNWLMYHPHLGANAIAVCPDYLYPLDTWTPELILKSYMDGSAPWLATTDSEYESVAFVLGRDNEAVLFSKDYNYIFIITDDGWLTINGVRSIPYQCVTYSDISPLQMAKYYQSGLWDGSRVWSEDYRTSVEFGYGTKLKYVHYDSFSGDDASCAYAFHGVATSPWWENQDQYKVDVYGEPGDRVIVAYVENFYPDLPDGKIEGNVSGELIDGYAIDCARRDATSVITTSGPYYFLRGELLGHWAIPVESASDAFLLNHIQYTDGDHVYFFSGDKFIDLRTDGEYKVLLDNICANDSQECLCWFFYLEDGDLKCIGTDDTEVVGRFDVITDKKVVAATGSYDVFLQFENDANVYHLDGFYSDGSYHVTALGSGTVEEYEAAWNNWVQLNKGYFDNFAEYCQTKNGFVS